MSFLWYLVFKPLASNLAFQVNGQNGMDPCTSVWQRSWPRLLAKLPYLAFCKQLLEFLFNLVLLSRTWKLTIAVSLLSLASQVSVLPHFPLICPNPLSSLHIRESRMAPRCSDLLGELPGLNAAVITTTIYS